MGSFVQNEGVYLDIKYYKTAFLAVLNMESIVYNDENEETIFIVSRDNSATTFNLNISHREVNHIVYKSNFYSNMNDESI